MKITASATLLFLTLTAFPAGPAAAADKETRQMMADLRILQEQAQQLQNLLASINLALAESVKTLNQRLDAQIEANRRAFADQKLVLDSVSNDLRVLREKVDDNSVRVGTVGQELDALRQSVAALSAPRPAPLEGDGTIPTDAPAAAPTGAAAVGASPQKLLDGAMGDYYSGQYDLAILGLESYIKTFPSSPQADYAQFHIGSSYINQGKYDRALDAYNLLITNYPRSSQVCDARVRIGLAYRNLKQDPKAREAWEFVIKNCPDTVAATQARQNLSTLQKP